MPPSPVSFYQDWQFWSAIVAAAALLLSQLPPVHILIRRARLRCEAFSMMHITHKVGNPNAQWHLILENTGGRSLRVREISLSFSKDNGPAFNLPIQNYLRTPDANQNVMFTPFRLEPGAEWAHVINFFAIFPRQEDKEYRVLESKIRSEILAQKEDPAKKDVMCEASQTTVQELIAFFEKRFKWVAGEYEIELKVTTDTPKADVRKKYRFSLFESESNELRGYIEGYRYGAGVYWVSPAQPGLLIPVHENDR